MKFRPIVSRPSTAARCLAHAMLSIPIALTSACQTANGLKRAATNSAAAVVDGGEAEVKNTATATPSPTARRPSMSEIRIVHEYSEPPAKVWRALTDPQLMALWMIAARPEGFSTAVGTRFQFVGKPRPGWRGIVECEVLESCEPSVFRYSWIADLDGEVMQVTYRLEPHGGGTRFTFEHTGFVGVGGFVLAKLVMTPVREQMFGVRLPAVLDKLDDKAEPDGSPPKSSTSTR